MKKILVIGAVIVVTLIALGVAGFAYAQAQNPPTPQPGNGVYQNFPGQGMMGFQGRAGMLGWRQGFRQGMMRGYANGLMGGMHDYMIQALAAKLNLSVEDLQSKINSGERPYEIAKAQGLTDAQIQELMEQAHDEALKAAVAAGVLTQAQADAMDQRMEQMWQNGVFGGLMGGRGFGVRGCPGMSGSATQQP